MVCIACGTACQELPLPSWLLDDTPTMLALRVEVVEEGQLSALVGPVPADRTRHEALPGDTVSFTPWVTSGVRTWAPDEVDVAYFVCLTFDCYTALTLRDAELTCTDELDPAVPICAAGRGANATYRLPTRPLSAAVGRAQIIAIAGMPGRGDTDACIATMRRRPRDDLSDCMLLQRPLATGPYWVSVLALDPEDKLPEPAVPGAPTFEEIADALAAYSVPLEVLAQWPDLNPELESFTVSLLDDRGIRIREAKPGDTVRIPSGVIVQVNVDVDPRDTQRPAIELVDEDGTVLRDDELLLGAWYATRELADFTGADEQLPGLRVTWNARPEDGETRVDALIRDNRGGTAWGSLVFVVDDENPDE
jgi:hypothetical protein